MDLVKACPGVLTPPLLVLGLSPAWFSTVRSENYYGILYHLSNRVVALNGARIATSWV